MKVLIVVIVFVLSGCAGAPLRTISAVETDSTVIIHNAGLSCAVSKLFGKTEDKFVAISVCGAPVDSQTTALKISVLNKIGFPITVLDKDITASYDRQALKIGTYEDMLRKEKNRQMWANIGASMAAVGNSYSASNAGYSTTNGTVTGTYGGQRAYGTYSSTTYDNAAAQEAQRRAAAQSAETFRRNNEIAVNSESALEAIAFRSQTVSDGDFYRGMLEMQLPKKDDTTSSQLVEVKIFPDGNEMTFTLRID